MRKQNSIFFIIIILFFIIIFILPIIIVHKSKHKQKEGSVVEKGRTVQIKIPSGLSVWRDWSNEKEFVKVQKKSKYMFLGFDAFTASKRVLTFYNLEKASKAVAPADTREPSILFLKDDTFDFDVSVRMKRIAFNSAKKIIIKEAKAEGKDIKILNTNGQAYSLSFSKDGQFLAFISEGKLNVYDIEKDKIYSFGKDAEVNTSFGKYINYLIWCDNENDLLFSTTNGFIDKLSISKNKIVHIIKGLLPICQKDGKLLFLSHIEGTTSHLKLIKNENMEVIKEFIFDFSDCAHDPKNLTYMATPDLKYIVVSGIQMFEKSFDTSIYSIEDGNLYLFLAGAGNIYQVDESFLKFIESEKVLQYYAIEE